MEAKVPIGTCWKWGRPTAATWRPRCPLEPAGSGAAQQLPHGGQGAHWNLLEVGPPNSCHMEAKVPIGTCWKWGRPTVATWRPRCPLEPAGSGAARQLPHGGQGAHWNLLEVGPPDSCHMEAKVPIGT